MGALQLGKRVLTPGAHLALLAAGTPVTTLLARHQSGDWGSLDRHDRQANSDALEYGGRVISRYELVTGDTVLVATEANRSATTILLSSEY